MQGIKIVRGSKPFEIRSGTDQVKPRLTMQPWREISEIKESLDNNLYELGVIPPFRSTIPGQESLGLLDGSIVSLEGAMTFASDFAAVAGLRSEPTQAQYRVLHPLRSRVVWPPVFFLSVTDRSLQVMVSLAHFYVVALAVQLHLLAPGPIYYPKMRMQAIKVLTADISSLEMHMHSEGIDEAIKLMRFPIETAAHFRGRPQSTEEVHAPRDTPAQGEDILMADSICSRGKHRLQVSGIHKTSLILFTHLTILNII